MKKKKKKLTKIGLFFVIFVFVLLVCVIGIAITIKTKRLVVELEDNITLSLNSERYNTDYIKKLENGEVINDKVLIDTSTLGKKDISLEIKDLKGKVKTYTYQVNVIDDESPTIEYENIIEIEEGEKIDLLSKVKVIDNSKEEITPTVEGKYDINKAGEYNLKYVATDSSGNTTKEDFTLKVNARKTNSNTNTNTNTNTNKPSNGSTNSSSSNNNTNNNEESGEVHFTTSKGFKGVTKNGITYIDGYLIVNKTYSLPKNYVPANTYGNPTSTSTTQCANCIEKAAYDKWNEMKSDALAVGLTLKILSGYRSYTLQSNLYNRYVSSSGKTAADTYSARPGHSEHQSGLAFDLNQINDGFIGTPEAIWLDQNCYKYGYILRYPKGKSNETGYKYEPWHFRYVGIELATKLYNNGDWITMEDYFGITSEYE